MEATIFRGKTLIKNEWKHGDLTNDRRGIFISESGCYGWSEVYPETVSRFLPMPDTNIEGVYVDSDIFEFDCAIDEHKDKPIRLRGVMNFDDLELRYQIEIFSKEYPQYVCLWYKPDAMKNFQIIGNKIDNPELLNQ